MPDIIEIVKRIKEFRRELADMRQLLSKSGHYDWDGPDEGLLNEKLKRWTSRVYEALKAWGFTTEAEEGFGKHSGINMYDGVDTRAKMKDERLRSLQDDISRHPEHYLSRLLGVSPRAPKKRT